MKTVNSLSGGKTSSYLAANYPADYNVFSLVRTNDKSCLFPDEKLRQEVSDRIGCEFIGTLEEDMIIYTMLDLEQFIGQKIHWVTGKTFDDIIMQGKKKYLPNVTQRFCTTLMKLQPIFDWWIDNFEEPVEMRIGYRANETNRVLNTKDNTTYKTIVGKRKDGRNKWADVEWRKLSFPLFDDRIFKDNIDEFWKDKPVRFAYMNNCVGCFHRNPMLLKLMSEKCPNKFDWFVRQEDKDCTFINKITYQKIKEYPLLPELSFDDFTECDSGSCGL